MGISRNLSQSLDFRKISKVVVINIQACWWHLSDSRRVVAVYYKSVNCNPLTCYFDLLWICYTTCLCSWQDFDWYSASCGPSAVAQLVCFIVSLWFFDIWCIINFVSAGKSAVYKCWVKSCFKTDWFRLCKGDKYIKISTDAVLYAILCR